MDNRPKVVVAGHICLDITPVLPADAMKEGDATRYVIVPGTLTRVRGVDIHSGGAVANTGMAMEFFGADVSLMGKLGKDAFGSLVMELLGARGMGKGMIRSEGASTSYSIVIAVPGSDRAFLHDPGANDDFRFSDLDFRVIRKARLFHFGYPTLMRSMFRDNGAELARMFKEIDGAGVMTSLDLASIDEKSESGGADWPRILADTLPHVDFFMPSYEELAFMLDRGALGRLRARASGGDVASALSLEEDVAPLAERAMALGAKIVLIKCGAKGLYYRTADKAGIDAIAKKHRRKSVGPRGVSLNDWIDRSGFEKSYAPERVVSATGAGDSAIAAFLTAMLKGYPFERCVRLSAATGACCVESYDALGSLKPFKELEAKIDSGWRKSW